VDWFEKYNKNDILLINESRQNLADETGLCLKKYQPCHQEIPDGIKLIVKKGQSDLYQPETV